MNQLENDIYITQQQHYQQRQINYILYKIQYNKNSMLQTHPQQIKDQFNKLWNDQGLKNKSKLISQNHVDQYNNNIFHHIIDGQLSLEVVHNDSLHKISKKVRAKSQIQKSIEQQYLRKISKQKEQLQNRLQYINNSISVMKGEENKQQQKTKINSVSKLSVDHIKINQNLREKQQLRQKQIERERKIQQLKRQARLKQEISENQRLQKIQQEKFERQKQKKNEIYQSIKKINQRMQRRELEVKQGNEKIKQLLHKQKIFEKLQKNYKQIQMSLLQSRKKKLQEIRNLHRPLDHKQLLNHQAKFLEHINQHNRQRQRKVQSMKHYRYEIPYQSVFYKKVKEEDHPQLVHTEQLKLQKMKLFSSHVRDNFKPNVSQKRKKQLEQSRKKELQQMIIKQKRNVQLRQKIREKGKQYLKDLQKLPKASPPPPTFQPEKKKYTNYLTHTERGSKVNTWNKIIQSKNNEENADNIYDQIMKAQNELKRRQELSRILKNKNMDEIDKQYYEMMKAKLQLLSDER